MKPPPPARSGAPIELGATPLTGTASFAVWSSRAEQVWLCLFDAKDRETAPVPLERTGDVWSITIPGAGIGARYGFRADGPYAPAQGLWFDPQKLLVDPYARAIDRSFALDPRLSLPRPQAVDTAPIVPKSIVTAPPLAPLRKPQKPGLIYELNVRGATMRHPKVPDELRGTLRGLATPAIRDHLVKLGVTTLELMPVAAWIDDRHLAGIGLTNFWGYNPVTLMAPDSRLAPGGIADLRAVTDFFAEAGIDIVLDLVFNHTGEGDVLGPTLSLRGLDARAYYRHIETGTGLALANESGTGNVLACDSPPVIALILDAMRYWRQAGGVAGFRLDLAPILGRSSAGFDAEAPLLKAIRTDPVLATGLLIAEPWDVGQGGYRLSEFGPPFLEWNDRYRDDVRRFWRGDAAAAGDFATRLAGSSDYFGKDRDLARSVNFLAVHDGFTLADLVAYEHKHNFDNREGNRDGHDANFSWNNGVEGETRDAKILAARAADRAALLATLFVSRGTPLLGAGDEFGRSQRGNNNAYAQDNEIGWIAWNSADKDLLKLAQRLSALRRAHKALTGADVLNGHADAEGRRECIWLRPDAAEMTDADWAHADTLGFQLTREGDTVLIWLNRARTPQPVVLPDGKWKLELATRKTAAPRGARMTLPPRSVSLLVRSPARAGAKRGTR